MRRFLDLPVLACMLAIAASASFAQSLSAPLRDVSHEGVFPDMWSTEKWSNGLLLATSIGGHSAPAKENLIVWSPDRGVVGKFNVQCDGAGMAAATVIGDVAASSDGRVAVVGVSSNGSVRVGFLATIRLTDGSMVIVRTAPFLPSSVVFGSDNTIWISGLPVTVEAKHSPEFGDYKTIQHYDAGLRIANEYLPVSSFKCSDPANGSRLAASQNRIGIMSRSCGQWIEIGTDGKLLGAWQSPTETGRDVASVAMTADNEVYAFQLLKKLTLRHLSHSANQWETVSCRLGQEAGKQMGWLAGADGANIVYTAGSRLVWAKPNLE